MTIPTRPKGRAAKKFPARVLKSSDAEAPDSQDVTGKPEAVACHQRPPLVQPGVHSGRHRPGKGSQSSNRSALSIPSGFFSICSIPSWRPSLLGKTFDVDDGLLKKIRVAQFQPGRARIVLEVADRFRFHRLVLLRSAATDHRYLTQQRIQATKTAPEMPLKESAAANSEIRRLRMRPQLRRPSRAAAAEGKAQARIPADKPMLVTTSNGTPKTVVEADDDDDSAADRGQARSAGYHQARGQGTDRAAPACIDFAHAFEKLQPEPAPAGSDFPDVREASPTASGDRSLIRALGLKIGKIVIDPGHGGHDTGTIGPNGLEEKDLVLDVGRRLGKLLQARLGADVVYTRKDDTFIPLETRTSIANQEQADLFVSIHANSSRDPDARGVETYYLNFTSSAEALDVAARENAASDKSVYELQDLVKKIALKEKIEESREFASNVQRALHSGLAAKNPGIRDRGVKKAPFIVLIGANMPSILAEISFVSNPGDERRLQTSDYRQRIAESLYRGISKYVSGLSGVKVASKIDKGESQ